MHLTNSTDPHPHGESSQLSQDLSVAGGMLQAIDVDPDDVDCPELKREHVVRLARARVQSGFYSVPGVVDDLVDACLPKLMGDLERHAAETSTADLADAG